MSLKGIALVFLAKMKSFSWKLALFQNNHFFQKIFQFLIFLQFFVQK